MLTLSTDAMKAPIGFRVFTVFVPILLVSTACVGEEDRNCNEWANSTNYPYSATEKRSIEIAQQLPRLTLEMKRSQVRALFGNPDCEGESYPKLQSTLPKVVPKFWQYNLYKLEWGQNLRVDKQLSIYFDQDGQVCWIAALGLPDSPILNEILPSEGRMKGSKIRCR